MIASSISKRPYRHLPDPRKLSARIWKDPEFHMRLWTDPALRDAYAKVIDKALTDAITGKEDMATVGDALSDIVIAQVEGELLILGLRDIFSAILKPIKFTILGMILARMAEMKRHAELMEREPT